MELVCPFISCPLDGSIKAVEKMSSTAALFLTQRRRRRPLIQVPNQSCLPFPIFSCSPVVLMAAVDALVVMLAADAHPWPSPMGRWTPRCGRAFPSLRWPSPVHRVMHRCQESSQPGAHHRRSTQARRCRHERSQSQVVHAEGHRLLRLPVPSASDDAPAKILREARQDDIPAASAHGWLVGVARCVDKQS